MLPATERSDGSELVPPLNRVLRQGLEKDTTQVPSQLLLSAARTVITLLEQQHALSIDQARRLTAFMDDRLKSFGQSRSSERGLAILGVDVELAALLPGISRGVGFEDRRRDTIKVKDAREEQPTKARTNDRD